MLQAKIDKILADEMPTNELLAMLDDKNVFVRANALRQAANRMNEQVSNKIVEFVEKPENRKARFFGSISLSFLGIQALLESKNEKALNAASLLISRWKDEDEKEELIAFLKSEDVDLSELEISSEFSELQPA